MSWARAPCLVLCASQRGYAGNLNSNVPCSPSEPMPSRVKGLPQVTVGVPDAWDSACCSGGGGAEGAREAEDVVSRPGEAFS